MSLNKQTITTKEIQGREKNQISRGGTLKYFKCPVFKEKKKKTKTLVHTQRKCNQQKPTLKKPNCQTN